MKKLLVLSLLGIFVLQFIAAINVNVQDKGSSEVAIPEINRPATFNLTLTNLGQSTSVEFYNLVGFNMFPKGTISLNSGESKDVKLNIYPRNDIEYNGFYTFDYHIRATDGTEVTKNIKVKVIKLSDSFEIGSGEIDPDSNSMQIYVYNREKINYDNIHAKFDSPFFSIEKDFSLGPNEKKVFDVQLKKEDFNKLLAGFYTLKSDITVNGVTAKLEGTIKFVEKDILTTTSKDYGLVVNTKIIEKKNEGNTETHTETVIKKNIISRLFTTFSPEPNAVERQNLVIYYTWSRNIPPGESLDITVKTNWLFPFLIVILLAVIVILAQQYKMTDLVLRKRVSFVRAKGGEFALKVSMAVHAKNDIERVSVADRLPNLVKVYERFGNEKPKRINEKLRRIEWEFGALEKGETRILSYIIYSKVGVVGKFALPEAAGVYERNGKVHETQSNRAFFIAEQGKSEVEDY